MIGRLAVLGLVATALVITAAGSCTVNHRSGEFACSTPADCSSNRTCIDGLCVATQLDAGVDAPTMCPAQCTSCDLASKRCTINCMLAPEACKQAITCPAGWACNVACSTPDACRNGVDCRGGTSCDVTCSSPSSCRGVQCGAGPCRVDCIGRGSCREVDCGASCGCDVFCGVDADCANVTCKSTACFAAPLGCTALGVGCGCM